jgi:uncharacterized membrane protein HdeD (DUF308 family)
MKIKIGKHKLVIKKGSNWSYITGIVSAIFGFVIVSNIMNISGYYNRYLFSFLWLVFSFTILARFGNPIEKTIIKIFKKKKKEVQGE